MTRPEFQKWYLDGSFWYLPCYSFQLAKLSLACIILLLTPTGPRTHCTHPVTWSCQTAYNRLCYFLLAFYQNHKTRQNRMFGSRTLYRQKLSVQLTLPKQMIFDLTLRFFLRFSAFCKFMVMIITISQTVKRFYITMIHAKIAIFPPFIWSKPCHFCASFSALFPTGTRLACNPLTKSLTSCALASCTSNRLHVGRTDF